MYYLIDANNSENSQLPLPAGHCSAPPAEADLHALPDIRDSPYGREIEGVTIINPFR